jgi:hypothetical protein
VIVRLVVGLSVACSACTDDYVVKVGLTGTESDFAAPASAPVGADFTVSLKTYGGGCIEPYDTQLTVTNEDALVVPRDEYYVRGDVGCNLILIYYEHQAVMHFDTPGTKTIRIRGRQQKPLTAGSRELVDELVDYPFAVVIE